VLSSADRRHHRHFQDGFDIGDLHRPAESLLCKTWELTELRAEDLSDPLRDSSDKDLSEPLRRMVNPHALAVSSLYWRKWNLKAKLESCLSYLISSAKTVGTFNTDFGTFNLRRPTSSTSSVSWCTKSKSGGWEAEAEAPRTSVSSQKGHHIFFHF